MNGSNFGRIPALLIWSNMWKRPLRILAKNIKLILYRHLVAFACNDEVDKSQLMQPVSAFLRDIGRVHGQWKLRDVNPFTKKCRFELSQHEDEYIGLGCMIPTLFWTKQHM